MAVDTGIDKIAEIHRAQEERSRARAASDLWNRIHSLIRSIPGRDVSEHRSFCMRLEQAPCDQREAMILAEYGQICLDKVRPLLWNLNTISG